MERYIFEKHDVVISQIETRKKKLIGEIQWNLHIAASIVSQNDEKFNDLRGATLTDHAYSACVQ